MKKDEINYLDDFDDDDDDDDDDVSVRRTSNTAKSLAPLFIYKILKQESSDRNHFTQQDIIERLDQYPYSISLERKAVSRHLHTLAGEQIGIRYSAKSGAWYDKSFDLSA